MTVCIYCIDNDILKKLATFDLFSETISLFDASNEQINILETAKYKFKNDWKKFQEGRLRNPEDKFVNYERIIELTEQLPQIFATEITDTDLFEQLSKIEGIDQGEAILTSYVTQVLQKEEGFQALIFTGDKTFLRALAKVDLPVIQVNFAHRFWCLEQLIHKDIDYYGFEPTCAKIVPVLECDKAIQAVFGSGVASTPENSLPTLKSYIESLRNETGNLLHPYPNQL